MRIRSESRYIYMGNVNTNQSIYNILIAQQDDTKKLMDVEFIVFDGYSFYVEQFLIGITNDLFDVLPNSTSNFLFYYFNIFN